MSGDLQFSIEMNSNSEPVLKGIVVGADASKGSFERAAGAAQRFAQELESIGRAQTKFSGLLDQFGRPAESFANTVKQVTLLGPGLIQTSAGANQASGGVRSLADSARGLTPIIGAAVGELSGMESGANLVTKGLTGLVIGGITPVGVALSAGLLAFGVYQDHLRKTADQAEQARDRLRTFAAAVGESTRIQNQISLDTRGLGATTDFERNAVQQEQTRQQLVQSFGRMLTDERLSGEQAAELRRQRWDRLAELDENGIARHEAQARNLIASLSRADAMTATNVMAAAQRSEAAAREAGAVERVAQAYQKVQTAAMNRIKEIDRGEFLEKGADPGANIIKRAAGIQQQLNEIAKTPGQFSDSVFDIWLGKRVPSGTPFDRIREDIEQLQKDANIEFGIFVPPTVQSFLDTVDGQFKKLKGEKIIPDLDNQQALGKVGEVDDRLKKLSDRDIDIKADGSQALSEADRVKNALDRIPNQKVIKIVGLPGGPSGVQPFTYDPSSGATHLVGQYGVGNYAASNALVTKTIKQDIDMGVVASPRHGFTEFFESYGPSKVKQFTDQLNKSKVSLPIEASGSPSLPFSDYFSKYAPGVLDTFASQVSNSAGLTFGSNILGLLVPLMNRASELQAIIQRGVAGRMQFGASILFNNAGESAELNSVINTIQMLSRLLGKGGFSGGGGGGVAPITAHFHFENSTFYGEGDLKQTIQDVAIPAFEDFMQRTTGGSLQTKVYS